MRALVLALGLALAPLAALADITVTGLDGHVTRLSAKDLADLRRDTAVLHDGTKATPYEGPTLAAVLRAAGVPVGMMAHGDPMHAYVEVKGTDGYRVVLSLAEADPDFHDDGAVVLGDTENGAPLDAKEGPYRLVIGDDLKPWRSVRNVASITVTSAP